MKSLTKYLIVLFFIGVLCLLTTSITATPSINIPEVTKIQISIAPQSYSPSGEIACNDVGERIFIINNDDNPASQTIEAFSFNGSAISYISGVTISNWSAVDIKCNNAGTRVFLAVNGKGGLPEAGYQGVLALDFDGSTLSTYSLTWSPYDANDGTNDIAYNEDDDVVFTSVERNGIAVFKNNGLSYAYIGVFQHDPPDYYRGVAYNDYDGHVYILNRDKARVYCYGWGDGNNTLYAKAYSSAFQYYTCSRETISGEYGTLFCPSGGVADPNAVRWNSIYDGSTSLGARDGLYDDCYSFGLCWVGTKYFVLAQGSSDLGGDYTHSDGLVLAELEGGNNPVKIDTYDPGLFFRDVAYTNNNFSKASSVNGHLFALVTENYWLSHGYIYVFEIAGLDVPPEFSNPDPANESIGVNPSLEYWNVTITDPNGDNFDYTIECSNGDNRNGTSVTNGTYTLNLSTLDTSTTYTIWVNATDSTGSGEWTRETFWFRTEGRTIIDHFFIQTEEGANLGWDLDNNNITLDITYRQLDGEDLYLLFTFNKGSQARVPTLSDYDSYIWIESTPNGTLSDYDLGWYSPGLWSDYIGIIYVRVAAMSFETGDFTEGLYYSTLTNGIDGTAPSTSVDDIPGYNRSYRPLIITATATDSPSIATLYNVTLYYSYSNDNVSFSSWTLFQTDYAAPFSWKFPFTEGAGWYKFGTRGLDLAGNLEAIVVDDMIFFTAAYDHESGTDLVEKGLGVAVGDLILFILTCSFIVVAAADVRIAAMFATLLYSVLFIIYFEATAFGITGYDPVKAGICVAVSIVVLALLLLSAGKSKARMGYIP